MAGLAGCNLASRQDVKTGPVAGKAALRPLAVTQRPAGYAENSAVFIFADGAGQAPGANTATDNTLFLPEVTPVDGLPAWERFAPSSPKP